MPWGEGDTHGGLKKRLTEIWEMQRHRVEMRHIEIAEEMTWQDEVTLNQKKGQKRVRKWVKDKSKTEGTRVRQRKRENRKTSQ